MKPFGIIKLVLESKTYVVGSCKLMLCFNILQQQNLRKVFSKPTNPPTKTVQMTFCVVGLRWMLPLSNKLIN